MNSPTTASSSVVLPILTNLRFANINSNHIPQVMYQPKWVQYIQVFHLISSWALATFHGCFDSNNLLDWLGWSVIWSAKKQKQLSRVRAPYKWLQTRSNGNIAKTPKIPHRILSRILGHIVREFMTRLCPWLLGPRTTVPMHCIQKMRTVTMRKRLRILLQPGCVEMRLCWFHRLFHAANLTSARAHCNTGTRTYA